MFSVVDVYILTFKKDKGAVDGQKQRQDQRDVKIKLHVLFWMPNLP